MAHTPAPAETHNHFLALYGIALADFELHPNELCTLYAIGERRGVDREQIDAILLTPHEASPTIPEDPLDRVECLYDVALMIQADGVVEPRERRALKRMCAVFGFAEENVIGITDFLLDQAAANVPAEQIRAAAAASVPIHVEADHLFRTTERAVAEPVEAAEAALDYEALGFAEAGRARGNLTALTVCLHRLYLTEAGDADPAAQPEESAGPQAMAIENRVVRFTRGWVRWLTNMEGWAQWVGASTKLSDQTAQALSLRDLFLKRTGVSSIASPEGQPYPEA